jgi:hypothetical protein
MAFVAFRDNINPLWQLATQQTPTDFVASVTGPYWVTAVCEIPFDTGGGTTLIERDVWQAARTPGDGLNLTSEVCFAPDPTPFHNVFGAMVQGGNVILGNNSENFPFSNWGFDLFVPEATYNLYADTADHIAIRRGIAVTADTTLTPPIDVNAEGVPLVNVAFTIPNAAPNSIHEAAVRIEQASATFPGPMYLGPAATAKAIPSAVLTAGDNQTASVREILNSTGDGYTRVTERSLRKPFHVGDPTAFTEPGPIVGTQWSMNGLGELAVGWNALPPDLLYITDIEGNATGHPDPIFYFADLSPAFLSATGVQKSLVDTNIPGFHPEWKIDYTLGYTRDLIAQTALDGELGVIRTTSVTDTVAPTAPVIGRRSAPSRPAAPRPHGPAKAL